MCGLTMDCRHPELSQVIKDPEGQVITVDDFLKLPHWNGIVVSKGDLIPKAERPSVRTTPPLAAGALIPEKSLLHRSVKKPDAKIAAARERKVRQARLKAQTKRGGEESSAAPKKKRARKNGELVASRSKGTLSPTPLSHSIPKPINEVTSPQSKETEKVIASGSRPKNAGKEVVDISKNTSDPTPPFVNTIQEEEHIRRSNSQKHAHSFHFVHDEDNDEDADQYRCTYQSLGQSILSQSELLKRHELLNRNHVDLFKHTEFQVVELDRLRSDYQREMQKNEGDDIK
ncbi:hypothetical protein Tco_1333313 [Tanacetum coccineum]